MLPSLEWEDYLNKQALNGEYLTGEAFTDFLEKDEEYHKKLMTEAGLAAQ